jgi:hypothetical protein
MVQIPNHLIIPMKLILETPNDSELGAKIRELYWKKIERLKKLKEKREYESNTNAEGLSL